MSIAAFLDRGWEFTVWRHADKPCYAAGLFKGGASLSINGVELYAEAATFEDACGRIRDLAHKLPYNTVIPLS